MRTPEKACSCGGCGRCCADGCAAAGLTEWKLAVLDRLACVAFLPAAYDSAAGRPVCLALPVTDAETGGAALAGLQRKGLISIDYDLPLQNCDYSAYAPFAHHGSIALTARGQRLADRLDELCQMGRDNGLS